MCRFDDNVLLKEFWILSQKGFSELFGIVVLINIL